MCILLYKQNNLKSYSSSTNMKFCNRIKYCGVVCLGEWGGLTIPGPQVSGIVLMGSSEADKGKAHTTGMCVVTMFI
jgi:hypothetical protein